MSDDIEFDVNDWWPVEGVWSPFDLGIKHAEDGGVFRPPPWFDEDEIEEYEEGFNSI